MRRTTTVASRTTAVAEALEERSRMSSER